jgi:hypothetical protein
VEKLQDYQIESGDYQIQVHILEVRDLKPKNCNGLRSVTITH